MSRVTVREHPNDKFINTINGALRKQQTSRTNQLKPTDWIAPTFQNSWVNFGSGTTGGYYVDGASIVRLKGKVKSGTINAAIFTLPTGYRPSETLTFTVPSNDAFGVVTIDTSGVVKCTTGSNVYVSLDGISFRTA